MQDEIAAVVRALRSVKGADYEDLSEVNSQANLSRMEQGKTQITLAKLQKIADLLDFDLVALVALSVSLRDNSSAKAVLEKASRDLHTFSASGGLEEIARHWKAGDGLVKRSRGKPARPDMIRAVLELKAKGMTKVEVSQVLDLSEATVRRHWLKDMP